jgi:hypothetical protein
LAEERTARELYRIDVFLERKLTTAFQNFEQKRPGEKDFDLRGEISWTKNMINICKRCEDDVKESGDNFNYRFRVKAKEVLSPQLYDEIAEYAKRAK